MSSACFPHLEFLSLPTKQPDPATTCAFPTRFLLVSCYTRDEILTHHFQQFQGASSRVTPLIPPPSVPTENDPVTHFNAWTSLCFPPSLCLPGYKIQTLPCLQQWAGLHFPVCTAQGWDCTETPRRSWLSLCRSALGVAAGFVALCPPPARCRGAGWVPGGGGCPLPSGGR